MTDERLPRILLIEDNPGDARYIRELLQDAEGFAERPFADRSRLFPDGSADEATDASTLVHETRLADGLERLDSLAPDVVLLDLNLPDSDGLDTLSVVRDEEPLVPIVVLTGVRDRQVGVDALRRGADEFLVKDELTPDLLVRSLHHAIERKAHEQELKQYEALVEESTDATAIVGDDGTIRFLTPAAEGIIGHDRESLYGEVAFEYIHDEDVERVSEEFDRMLSDPDYRSEAEFRFKHADGSWIVLSARARNLLDDPSIGGVVVYTHDITERKEYEQRLQAMNHLNEVVRDISDAVIAKSTRGEIERIACERLADSDSYEFAWIGETHPATGDVEARAMAGIEGYLDDVAISVDTDDPKSEGPTGRALRTGETQTVQNVREDPQYEPWWDIAEEYGFEASAAIPIRHEDTTFGVLNVYTDRRDGFQQEERTVLDHLGEILGHAIASVQRKQALMSDTVVELEIGIPDVVDAVGVDVDRLELDQAVAIGDEEFLVYGRADDLATVEAMVEDLDSWEEVTAVDEDADPVRFQIRLSEPPMLSAIAAVGGSVEHAVVADGDYRMTVHLPESADVRTVIDTVQDIYPQADALARRQVSSSAESAQQVTDAWLEELTDRQLTAIEVAYFSGFFDWPRGSSGEEVAESLGVSSPTFHQHVRRAERKLLDVVLSEAGSGRLSTE